MSHARIEEMIAESGLDAEEMSDVLVALAPLAAPADEVPAPTAELAKVLGPGHRQTGREVSQLFGPRRSAVVGVLVLALSGVGATGLSAAANTLPRPLQHEVSKFSRHYLPFDLPEPPPQVAPELPLGAGQPQPGDPRLDDGVTASRSAQPRQGVTAEEPAADHPDTPLAQAHPTPSASPSLAPSSTASAEPQSGYAPRPSTSSSPSPSPSAGGSTPGKGTPDPRDGHKSPGKGHGKPGPGDGKGGGQGGGPGPGTDPGDGQANPGNPAPGEQPVPDPGQEPAPGGGETTPTLPVVPEPTLPVPDPSPGLGAIIDGITGDGN
jgi:hypothetical protein